MLIYTLSLASVAVFRGAAQLLTELQAKDIKKSAPNNRRTLTSHFLCRCCAYYLQAFVQESAFSQTALQESVAQESATQHVSAMQHESVATHSVLALSQVVSLHFLLQHALMLRAATATITNNTFFMFFFCFYLTINSNSGTKLHFFSETLLLNVR